MGNVTLTVPVEDNGDETFQVQSWEYRRSPYGGRELIVRAEVKPRVVLPADVGAIIAYTNSDGHQRRAIRNPRGWDVYGLHGTVLMNLPHDRMTDQVQKGSGYEVVVPGFPPSCTEARGWKL